jgi:hypothetical protein
MGQVVIHGISFAQDCFTGNSRHGFDYLFEWYQANRIAYSPFPITASIGGGKAFQGFLTALTSDVQDPVHRTIQYQMTVSLLPNAIN